MITKSYAGDLAPRLIDELAALVDEVFVPLLSNPLNHEGWPLVVSQDILKQIHNLKSTVYEVWVFYHLAIKKSENKVVRNLYFNSS